MVEPFEGRPSVFVVGPTGSGKSDLAVHLVRQLGGSIVNCDSVQVYKYMDIGTAKPSVDERSQVPHYLFDFVEPMTSFTAGEYRREVEALLSQPHVAGPLFFTGGSGFYLQAIEKGMYDLPAIDDDTKSKVETLVQQQGLHGAYVKLKEVDPGTAEKISANDSYRIQRALCVYYQMGRPMGEVKREFERMGDEGLVSPRLKIGIRVDRDVLRERVEERTQGMLARGLMAEVESLIEKGWRDWTALQSVGYKECLSVIDGELRKDQLVAEISKNTMRLAKRQMTWFRRDNEIHWLDFSDMTQLCQSALDLFRSQNI